MEDPAKSRENNLPSGCPYFGPEEQFDDAVGIATVHHASAWEVNQKTSLIKDGEQTSSVSEENEEAYICHFLLPRRTEDPFYTFGRYTKVPSDYILDVYIPESRVARKQFTLFPDRAVNFWRIEADSETVTLVNGVPLQVVGPRTKKNKNRLPESVYLDPTIPNTIVVSGVEITLWLLKTPREALGPSSSLLVPPLDPQVQDVVSQQADWAQSRWILGKDAAEVSSRSERVLERFSGSVFTAKLCRGPTSGRDQRDREFSVMNMQLVDESIVRYLYTTEIRGIPSIITSTHNGFASYAQCHERLSKWHPGIRFQITTQLLRRLFTAIGFLHFNGILHRSLGPESILLRFADKNLERILVVDYSHARNVPLGGNFPRKTAVDDGRAIMELAIRCCDIWTLRNGPAPDAVSDEEVAQKTRIAVEEQDKVRRMLTRMSQKEKAGPESERVRELKELLVIKDNALRLARGEQAHNAERRVIRPLTKQKLLEFKKDWKRGHAESEKLAPMILSLGHSYLDGLVNKIHHENWDATPQEVCRQLQHLEGDCKEHWRLLTISKTFSFPLRRSVKSGNQRVLVAAGSFNSYLAFCIELHPNSRHAMCSAYQQHLRPDLRGFLMLADIANFTAEVTRSPVVPKGIIASLQKLPLVSDENRFVLTEQHHVWSHVPSRAFNLTQLQQLAEPSCLKTCVCDNTVSCDNFVEVKGGPDVQGCYAPLSLLPAFAQAFDLATDMGSLGDISKPIYDPSDFFQASNNGRLILAHRGLVGYASICRTADQITHCPKDVSDIQSTLTFLPTYFGDLEVLPSSPDRNINLPRPAHWSLFKPTEPTELDLDSTEPDTAIGEVLIERRKLRAEAVPPPPSQREASDSPPSKRFKSAPSLSERLLRLGTDPPVFKFASLSQQMDIDPVQQSFTEVASSVDGWEGTEEDVEKMLEEMRRERTSRSTGLFGGFQVHGLSSSKANGEGTIIEENAGAANPPTSLSLGSTLVDPANDAEPSTLSSVPPKSNLDAAVQTSFLCTWTQKPDAVHVPETDDLENWEFVHQAQISETSADVQGPTHESSNVSMADTDHQGTVEVGARISDADDNMQEASQSDDESVPDTVVCDWEDVQDADTAQAQPDVAQELPPPDGEPMIED